MFGTHDTKVPTKTNLACVLNACPPLDSPIKISGQCEDRIQRGKPGQSSVPTFFLHYDKRSHDTADSEVEHDLS